MRDEGQKETETSWNFWSSSNAMNKTLEGFPSSLVPYGRRPVSSEVGRPSSLIVAIFLLATILSSCGFQLRGQASIPFKTLFVETDGYSLFANDLERAIRSGSQTRIAQDRNEAEAVLKIVREAQEKVILSLSTGGKVKEFELRYRVAYRLTDFAGNDLAPPGEIILRRDMTYDDTVVLAKESEEALLYRDMKADAVQQMLRRLSVAKPVA
jgi:LPS-assembly lipoprotein